MRGSPSTAFYSVWDRTALVSQHRARFALFADSIGKSNTAEKYLQIS